MERERDNMIVTLTPEEEEMIFEKVFSNKIKFPLLREELYDRLDAADDKEQDDFDSLITLISEEYKRKIL